MKPLHRSLAMGAAMLLAAACSTDTPVGVDSGVELAPVTSFAPGDLTIQVCKTWLDSEDPPTTSFTFEYTDGTISGDLVLSPFKDGEGNWAQVCANIPSDPDAGTGGWSADTELTITELTPAGADIARRWITYRDGAVDKVCLPEWDQDCVDFPTDADGQPNEVDEIPASVTVNVGEVAQVLFKNVIGEAELPLEIAKTAMASYDREHSWELTKTVEPSSHSGGPGESFSSDWTVTATKTTVEDDFQVVGVISVTNPNGFDVAFSLADLLDDGTVATITCPVSGDNTGTAPANGSVDCAYTASPSDASATENTATVTSDVGGDSTTEGFTWSVNVIGDDEVTLSDPRVDYSELISGTTVEIFPEIFECPTDVTLYVDGVYEYTEVNTAYLDGASTDLEASAEVTVRCEIPQMPQGCTPGFWRQAHHYPYWTGYTPDQLFSDVFEDAFPGLTLGEVVQLGGGGLKALGRHTVAALLNAASDEVNYGFGNGSAQAVIDAFNAVFPGGDYEGLKDDLEEYNEMGCSVDKSGDKEEKGGGGPPAGRGRPAR